MNFKINKYEQEDLTQMMTIWNEVVKDGIAFPQEDFLDNNTAKDFFKNQTYCGVAKTESNKIIGLYILHPNNIGRCSHIANASYAVSKTFRGNGVGKALVTDSLLKAKDYNYLILQFNAVVKSNISARRLYESLGFVQLGIIPNGFRHSDGQFEDICPYYHSI